jgi:SAM-dependent methyltransferase
MSHRIRTFLKYCLDSGCRFAERWRSHGIRSALVFGQCWFHNLWLRNLDRFSLGRERAACPVCRWRGRAFYAYDCGRFLVPRVLCPQCGSQERHRLFHVYVSRCDPTLLEAQGVLLHFAPESQVLRLVEANPRLQRVHSDRTWSVVRDAPRPVFLSDMQALPLADETVDMVVCLHVLEHVPDDRQGVRELWRVLRAGGAAYIMVPLLPSRESTREFGGPDPAVFDHYREYAPADFPERLAPFAVETFRAGDIMSAEEESLYGVPSATQVVYRCRKS